MARIRQHLLIIFGLVAMIAAGCTSDGSTDSETHWQSAMGHCSSSTDCQGDLSCICGVCTSTCSSEGECGAVAQTAECVSGQAQLPARCASEVGDGEGVCLEPCASDDVCEQRDPQLACENGHCASAGGQSQPEPDADVDADADTDTDADADADTDADTDADADDGQPPQPFLCEDGPVQCCEDLGISTPEDAQSGEWDGLGRLEFSLHSGPEVSPPYDAGSAVTASGVWQGTRSLAESISLEQCLDNAADLGLPCEVDHVGLFEDDDKVEYEFLIGLPKPLLDTLPTGVPVEVVRRMGGWSVLDGTTGVPLLVFGHSFGENNEESSALELPGLELSAATDNTQADEGVCLSALDYCERLYVFTGLRVVAGQEHVLGPGESVDVTAQGHRFRVWHAHSKHRYRGEKYHGWGAQCADADTSELDFALIWLGEE